LTILLIFVTAIKVDGYSALPSETNFSEDGPIGKYNSDDEYTSLPGDLSSQPIKKKMSSIVDEYSFLPGEPTLTQDTTDVPQQNEKLEQQKASTDAASEGEVVYGMLTNMPPASDSKLFVLSGSLLAGIDKSDLEELRQIKERLQFSKPLQSILAQVICHMDQFLGS